MDVKGKTIVITGASRGIGAGVAREALRRGMNVAVCARHLPAVDDTSTSFGMAVDVRDAEAVDRLRDAAVKAFGRIDCWINNAGVLGPIAPIRKCDPTEVQRHIDINVIGVFNGTRSFIQHLHEREGSGVLINISSGAATSAYAGWGAYCAGKAAVDRLTEVAALEEREHGLIALSIAPGIIDTDMQAQIRASNKEDFPLVEKFHELKRDDSFSSLEFVARSLLDMAFDPSQRPNQVCHRLPPGK